MQRLPGGQRGTEIDPGMRRRTSEAAKKQVLDRGVTAVSRSHAPGSTEMEESFPYHRRIMANKIARSGDHCT